VVKCVVLVVSFFLMRADVAQSKHLPVFAERDTIGDARAVPFHHSAAWLPIARGNFGKEAPYREPPY
jgi:hypothetical protein